MPDATELIKLIKKAALDAVDAGNPMEIVFGKVISTLPLQISIEQKMTLGAAQLILTRNVTDFKVDMTVSHNTESHTHTHAVADTYTGGGSADEETHKHAYSGRKEFTVHNGLVAGDSVLLLRMQGGQRFIVWDRIT